MRIRKPLSHLNILNVALLSVVVLFGLYVLLPALQKEVTFVPPAAKKQDEKAAETDEELPAPSPLEFALIADQNLFHPERRIPPEKKDAPPPLPKPEIVLHGTLVTEDMSVAYIDDVKAPYTTPGRGKRLRTMKKGESLSGFVLKEVGEDKILLVRGEEHMVVTLNDPSKPKAREAAPAAAPAPAGIRPGAVGQPPAPPSSGQKPPAATAPQPAAAQPPSAQAPSRAPAAVGGGDTKNTFLDALRMRKQR